MVQKFQEHLKGYFEDEKDFNSLGLKGNNVVEPVEQVEDNPLEDRLNKLEVVEQTRVIDQRTDNLEQELSGLEGQYPDLLGTPEKVMDFLDFSESNSARYRDGKGDVSLSHMLREYSFDHLQGELSHYKKLGENNSRNSRAVVNRSEIGAKETLTPKKFNSWNDIDPHDENLKQYFDD